MLELLLNETGDTTSDKLLTGLLCSSANLEQWLSTTITCGILQYSPSMGHVASNYQRGMGWQHAWPKHQPHH